MAVSEEQFFGEKLGALNDAFSPRSPIEKKALFFGRFDQVKSIINAMNDRGQHIVLYGERGVGKTSLANIVQELYRPAYQIVEKLNCNRDHTYASLWRSMLNRVMLTDQKKGIGFKSESKISQFSLSTYLNQDKDFTPTDITSLVGSFGVPSLFIFDEYDTVIDQDTKASFSDTIKDFSDNYPLVTILLVGIAEDVINLIGNHPSLERCLKQIKMPKMSEDELQLIIKGGLEKLNMTISHEVLNKIVKFSSGFPHYTHLLSKYSAKIALEHKSLNINPMHFDLAVDDAIGDSNESIRESYHRAILTSNNENKFKSVVNACAMAKEDEYDSFRTKDVVAAHQELTGEKIKSTSISYNLSKLCDSEKGEILIKVGAGNQIRYRFRNPILKAFIKLKIYREKASVL